MTEVPERLRRLVPWLLVLPAAALPIYLLIVILSGSRMQFGDYFYMLSSIFSESGRFQASGLLVHANEHLIALPKLLYALNVAWFQGSNISLGVLVWLVSVAVWALLWLHVRDFAEPGSATRYVLIWAVVIVAFPLKALHNYVYAMSGTAWILANALALAALALMVRDKVVGAGLLGALATFTYGTGLAVWPALFAVLLLRRRGFGGRDAFLVLAAVLAIAVERLTADPVTAHPSPTLNPLVLVRSLAIAAGAFLTEGAETAVLLGTVVLVVLVYALGFAAERRMTGNALFFVGTAIFSATALTLISITRSGFGDDTFTTSRYMSLAALLALATAVCALFVWGASPRWRLAVAGGCVAALVASVPVVTFFRGVTLEQNVAAIAARLGVAQDGYLRGYEPGSGPILMALGSYPFNGEFREDCGLLGQQLPGPIVSDSRRVEGTIDDIVKGPGDAAVNVSGWAYSPDPIACVLLIDDRETVIGAAVTGIERRDVEAAQGYSREDVGWAGVALRRSGGVVRAVALLEGSQRPFLLTDGTITEMP